jgi:hypothetical protein
VTANGSVREFGCGRSNASHMEAGVDRMSVRWMRLTIGALLLEIILMIALTPLSVIGRTVFLTAVPIGVFVFGYLVSWRILRAVPSAHLTHGTILGVMATAMYFGLISAAPEGFQGAVRMYGAPLFWFCQAMRIAGCVAGAARSRQMPSHTH